MKAIIAGVVVGAAFVFGVAIGGIGVPDAFAWLVAFAALGWAVQHEGKQALKVFAVAIIVLLVWVLLVEGMFVGA